MGEKTASSTTAHPVVKIDVIGDYDYVTVVGVWEPSYWEDFRENYGNSMNFINQGLRQLTLYPKQTDDLSIQRVYVLFKGTYPDNVLKAVKTFVTKTHKAHYVEVDNISGLVDFVNGRKAKNRLIKQIDMFAHGVPMKVEFGYGTSKLESYRLDAAQSGKLKSEMFEWDTDIYSYACRTAASINVNSGALDPKTDASLAQILADGTDSRVHAYACRTLYDQTYGTADQRKTGEKYAEPAKIYDKKLVNYLENLEKYNERLKAYQVANKVSATQLPNEVPPAAPQKPGTDEQMRLGQGEYQRKMMKNSLDQRPIDPRGAINPVRAAKSPEDMDAKYYQMLTFEPKAWKAE